MVTIGRGASWLLDGGRPRGCRYAGEALHSGGHVDGTGSNGRFDEWELTLATGAELGNGEVVDLEAQADYAPRRRPRHQSIEPAGGQLGGSHPDTLGVDTQRSWNSLSSPMAPSIRSALRPSGSSSGMMSASIDTTASAGGVSRLARTAWSRSRSRAVHRARAPRRRGSGRAAQVSSDSWRVARTARRSASVRTAVKGLFCRRSWSSSLVPTRTSMIGSSGPASSWFQRSSQGPARPPVWCSRILASPETR